MAKTATKARPRGRFGSGLLNGLTVHVIAAGVFAVSYYLHRDSCDRGERITNGLTLAAGIDVLLALAVLFITRSKNRGAWRSTTLGWAASYLLVIALFGTGVKYADSLESDCGNAAAAAPVPVLAATR